MNNTIWKYPCPIQDRFSLSLPVGAVPLSVGCQQHGPVGEEVLILWALVDGEEGARETHWFLVCGTGHPTAPPDGKGFLGTVQMALSGATWHVFCSDGGENNPVLPLEFG